MATQVDVYNRALQLLGTRTNVATTSESSNEANQLTIAYLPVLNWCLGLANWNFARKAGTLTLYEGPPPSPPGTWTAALPAPPWKYSYSLPTDFVRAIYLTNSDPNSNNTGWLGEPKRFILGSAQSGSVFSEILLTNESSPILIYTAQITTVDAWPWHFERLMAVAMAQTTCLALTANMKLLDHLTQTLEQEISIATQANLTEGLVIPDTTPELIQATGINYPYRRFADAPAPQPNRSRRGEDQ